MRKLTGLIVLLTLICSYDLIGDSGDSAFISKKTRKVIVCGSATAFGVGSLIGLDQAWYSSYHTGKFHLFNDNNEWLQMDKVGHVYSNYQGSRLLMESFDWAGFKRNEKLIVAGGIPLIYMTAIEIMDGFSRGWGFSWGDQVCNVAGSGLAVMQEALWNEQRFQLKFSYTASGLAKYNPALLGENSGSRILKDYNGQTYWLSISPFSFVRSGSRLSWLCISAGYGAHGMLGGHYNRVIPLDESGNEIPMERIRQYYLSVDLDLTKIKTRSKLLNGVLSVFNILKFPFPALEFSKNGMQFRPLQF